MSKNSSIWSPTSKTVRRQSRCSADVFLWGSGSRAFLSSTSAPVECYSNLFECLKVAMNLTCVFHALASIRLIQRKTNCSQFLRKKSKWLLRVLRIQIKTTAKTWNTRDLLSQKPTPKSLLYFRQFSKQWRHRILRYQGAWVQLLAFVMLYQRTVWFQEF